MNQQEPLRTTSFAGSLLLTALLGFATVLTACPPENQDAADTATETPATRN